MTDYDAVRTCCQDANICGRCWVFISAAVKVLDSAIRDQFGYTHLLWVYSGRRGIHLWISDKEAMELTDEERKAAVNYLTVVVGGKEMRKKVNVRQGSKPLPPSIGYVFRSFYLHSKLTFSSRAALHEHLTHIFPDLILSDQDCFRDEKGADELLSLIPDKGVVQSLKDKWKSDPDRSSDTKWSDIKVLAKKFPKDSAQRVSCLLF